jgi:hypothetical protein
MFNESVVVVYKNVCQPFGETHRINFNGDRLPDLATWNAPSGNWRIGLVAGGFSAYSISSIALFNWGSGTYGDVPTMGDYDGDGKTDYSVFRDSTGVWWTLLSANSSWSVIQFGLPGDIPAPADYDGGGKTDIAVFRPSDGNWYFWFTETQSFGAVHFGASGDRPVPADYDGDGRVDAAVFRPSEGNWYFLRSSDNGYTVVHWGVATDKPAAADYDGDGKTDIAVFRNGDWYILRSSNNSTNVVHWGAAGDQPFPMYLDREMAVPVVYREASSYYWYIYNPGPVSAGVSFGQAGFTPIYFGPPNN